MAFYYAVIGSSLNLVLPKTVGMAKNTADKIIFGNVQKISQTILKVRWSAHFREMKLKEVVLILDLFYFQGSKAEVVQNKNPESFVSTRKTQPPIWKGRGFIIVIQ